MKKKFLWVFLILSSCVFSACKSDSADTANTSKSERLNLKDGMQSSDSKLAEQAVGAATKKGKDMLPQLREWAASDDPRLRLRAHTAIGRITGQWGSQTDLVWNTSFDEAIEKAKASREADPKKIGKPIMLLQLFGKLNEEFC